MVKRQNKNVVSEEK